MVSDSVATILDSAQKRRGGERKTVLQAITGGLVGDVGDDQPELKRYEADNPYATGSGWRSVHTPSADL